MRRAGLKTAASLVASDDSALPRLLDHAAVSQSIGDALRSDARRQAPAGHST